MTGIQYNIIKMAKAIEYYDKFTYAGFKKSPEKEDLSKEAFSKIKILEKGIFAYAQFPYDKEIINKALALADEIEKEK